MNIRCLFCVTLLAASGLPAASVAVVTTGEEYCNTIRLPGGWRVADYDKLEEFQRGTEYEFRQIHPGSSEYLVAAISTESHWRKRLRDYSVNKFWVDLTGNRRPRPATEDEWKSAAIVPVTAELLDTSSADPRSAGRYRYAQRSFAKSGPRWPALGDQVRVSADGRWIAVQSWKGASYQDAPDVLLNPPISGSERFFIDVYDVSSGNKLIGLDGIDRDFAAGDAPLHATFWLDSRYFIVPLGLSRQKFLACEAPETFPSADIASE
jgi:hypothetical protein